MNPRTIVQQYRSFLLIVSGGIFAATVVELWLTEHVESAVQIVPFALCGLGICAVIAVFTAPRRRTLFALRAVMGMVALGSLFGIYEHVEHNVAFELEIRPNATVGEVFGEALRGGSPMLAPGILALAAVLATAATYYHPALIPPTEK